MTIEIRESGMVFGQFEEVDVFLHEQALKQIRFGDHVKMVEFFVRTGSGKKAAVALVEARSSIPRACEDFLEEIRQKINYSLIVWFAALVGRHPIVLPLIPPNLGRVEHLKLPIKCYLVIPGVPDAQLQPFTDKLRKAMVAERRLWPINYEHIHVLNEVKATNIGLIGVPARN